MLVLYGTIWNRSSVNEKPMCASFGTDRFGTVSSVNEKLISASFVRIRLEPFQCKRKAYMCLFWYGCVWIRSCVNEKLICAGFGTDRYRGLDITIKK